MYVDVCGCMLLCVCVGCPCSTINDDSCCRRPWDLLPFYNPLGNLNSGRSPWAKLIRSASLQLVCDAAMGLNYFGVLFLVASIWLFVFFSTIRLKWLVQFECVVMWQNVYRQSPDGDREILLNIMLAVFRILDKLHSLSNILCTCGIFIKMWVQI